MPSTSPDDFGLYPEMVSAVASGVSEGIGRLMHDLEALGRFDRTTAVIDTEPIRVWAAACFGAAFPFQRFTVLNYMGHMDTDETGRALVLVVSTILDQSDPDLLRGLEISERDALREASAAPVASVLGSIRNLVSELRKGGDESDSELLHESLATLREAWAAAISSPEDEKTATRDERMDAIVSESLQFFVELYARYGEPIEKPESFPESVAEPESRSLSLSWRIGRGTRNLIRGTRNLIRGTRNLIRAIQRPR